MPTISTVEIVGINSKNERTMTEQNNLYQRAAGWFHHEHGITPIPVNGKKAIADWAELQTGATLDTINAQPWDNASGLAALCGVNGLTCLDADRCQPALEDLTGYLGIGEEWRVATPSGGSHQWLVVPDWAEVAGVGKVDQDCLPEYAQSETERCHLEIRQRGHYVLLPPSAHPDHPGRYRFVSGYPTSQPPTVKAIDLLSVYSLVTITPEELVESPTVGQPTALPGQSAEFIAENSLKRLAAWRCDDYAAWIGVGMALRALGDVGLGLWDGWSRNSEKWKPGACERAWAHLKAEGRTMASLVRWAQMDNPLVSALPAPMPVDLKRLGLPGDALNAIAGYAPLYGAPKPCRDRSEADWVAVKWLIMRGATDGQIVYVFRTSPIGSVGKMAERGDSYLADTIARARAKFSPMTTNAHSYK